MAPLLLSDSAPTSGTSRADARSSVARLLRAEGIDTADLDARLLVCGACAIDHLALVREPDLPIGSRAADILLSWTRRRLDREPVSRIWGRREFWGLDLIVTPDVLDPRPETEGLVGSVIDAVGGRGDTPLSILDLGTGSGAILCALLRELPYAAGIGIDRSIAACRVANANLEALGFDGRASVICGDWSDAVRARFDIVVSNPPYIPSADIGTLDRDVRDYDPLPALDGGTDGLDPYRDIAPRLDGLLRHKGVAAFECGWNQGESIIALLHGVLTGTTVYRDLAGHDRVVIGQKRSESPSNVPLSAFQIRQEP